MKKINIIIVLFSYLLVFEGSSIKKSLAEEGISATVSVKVQQLLVMSFWKEEDAIVVENADLATFNFSIKENRKNSNLYNCINCQGNKYKVRLRDKKTNENNQFFDVSLSY